jgi:hypothetical protein
MTLQFCDLYEAQGGLSLQAMLRFYSWLCLTCSPDDLIKNKTQLVAQWVNSFLETFFHWDPQGTLGAMTYFMDNLEALEREKEGIFARLKKSTKPQK